MGKKIKKINFKKINSKSWEKKIKHKLNNHHGFSIKTKEPKNPRCSDVQNPG